MNEEGIGFNQRTKHSLINNYFKDKDKGNKRRTLFHFRLK